MLNAIFSIPPILLILTIFALFISVIAIIDHFKLIRMRKKYY
jgi:hypothetical protein